MRKIAMAFLAILFSVSAFAQHTKKDLVGKWESTDSQSVGVSIQFLDTNKAVINLKGNVMPSATYTIDLPKNPARLDINILSPRGTKATLQGFLLFVDYNTIRWQIFPPYNERPAAFNEKTSDDLIVTLKRVK